MHDLTITERAAVNSQLADVLDRWGRNADLDCVVLVQAMVAVAALELRALRKANVR